MMDGIGLNIAFVGLSISLVIVVTGMVLDATLKRIATALEAIAAGGKTDETHKLRQQLAAAHNVLRSEYGQTCGISVSGKCDVCLEIAAEMEGTLGGAG